MGLPLCLECKRLNHPLDGDMTAWVAGLDQRVAESLSRAGLIQLREPVAVVTLGDFLTDYVGRRTDVKPSTIRHLKESRRYLVEFFGEDRALSDITHGDADDYRCHDT